MRSPEFFLLFLENSTLYFIILLFISIPFGLMIKKKKIHVIDPFFLVIVGCVCAYVVPFFLYKIGECPYMHLLYFCVSESLFWITFGVCSKPTKFQPYIIVNEIQYSRLLFKISIVIYIVSSLLTYMYVGVALFLEHRQELFANASSGSGLLGRLTGFAGMYIAYYTYHMIIKYRKFRYLFWLLLIIINSMLSGSKGAVLVLLTAYFIYVFFYQGKRPHVKKKYYLLFLLVPVFILMTADSSDSAGFIDALGAFMYRFMAFGDVYWYAYPNNVLEKVSFDHPYWTFFSGLLGPFRLLDYDLVDKSIGIQLFWAVEPSEYGVISGPNARLAVMGYCYWGWFGILFSIFCGWLMAYLLYGIRKYFFQSLLGIFIFGYLYSISVSIITDFSFFLNSVSTFLINIIIYGGFVILFSGFNIRYKRNMYV